jgi:hypothetical protein
VAEHPIIANTRLHFGNVIHIMAVFA